MSAEDPNIPGNHRNGASATINASSRIEIVMANGHRIVADQPPYQNGADEGPTPVDLMLASLCSCKASVMRKFADRKGYSLDSATVFARWVKTGQPAQPDAIHVEIDLRGDLTDDQKKRIYAASNACPVQRMFANATPMESVFTATPSQPFA